MARILTNGTCRQRTDCGEVCAADVVATSVFVFAYGEAICVTQSAYGKAVRVT